MSRIFWVKNSSHSECSLWKNWLTYLAFFQGLTIFIIATNKIACKNSNPFWPFSLALTKLTMSPAETKKSNLCQKAPDLSWGNCYCWYYIHFICSKELFKSHLQIKLNPNDPDQGTTQWTGPMDPKLTNK